MLHTNENHQNNRKFTSDLESKNAKWRLGAVPQTYLHIYTPSAFTLRVNTTNENKPDKSVNLFSH